MGDEKLIEDTHQHIRDCDRKARHNRSGFSVKFLQMVRSPILPSKSVECLQINLNEVMQTYNDAPRGALRLYFASYSLVRD